MAQPKVSIVIPVYNGANYLAQAIDSALAQTYRNCEVLVVDDGSTDGGATEAIAKSFGDRVRYFYKTNGHVASALNFGIRHMTGDYFSWLSHDDLYHRRKVEAQIECANANESRTIVYSDFETLNVDTGVLTAVRLPHVDSKQFRYFITLNSMLHGCTVLAPRRCLDECGPFNETLRTIQDYDMWYRLAGKCNFVHLPEVLVTSRHHAGQGTRQMRELALTECDRLRSAFVRDLSTGEIRAATGSTLPRSYAMIATTFSAQGFTEASEVAKTLARNALQLEPPLSRMVDTLYVALRGRTAPLLNLSRRALSNLRSAVRKLTIKV